MWDQFAFLTDWHFHWLLSITILQLHFFELGSVCLFVCLKAISLFVCFCPALWDSSGGFRCRGRNVWFESLSRCQSTLKRMKSVHFGGGKNRPTNYSFQNYLLLELGSNGMNFSTMYLMHVSPHSCLFFPLISSACQFERRHIPMNGETTRI